MSSRPFPRVLRDADITDVLEDSDLDILSDGDQDNAVNEAPAEQDNISSDSDSGSPSSCGDDTQLESELDSRPLSVSSTSSIRRGRSARRGGARTRGGRSRQRGGVRTRGGAINRGRVQYNEQSHGNDVGQSAEATNNWNGQFSPLDKPLFQPRYVLVNTEDWVPEDFFKQYIGTDLLEKIVNATNRTFILKTGKELKLTVKELKAFIGILLIMGASNLPKIRLYWSRHYGVKIVKDAMTRTRFFTIRSSLKVVYDADVSEQEKSNKIWKVAPIFEAVLRGCRGQQRMDHISIDEMIIPFSGHCGIRQYCPGKPNPVGIKVFVLANPSGIVCDMLIYQGNTTFPDLMAQGFTLGESAILSLCESLVPGHYLYFDRYFTTIKLATVLLERGFHVTGTIQRNRLRDCKFTPEKEFNKKPRGTSETLSRNDGAIAVTRWLDNKPVIVLSTCYAANLPDQCRRWSKRNKQYEVVSRPEVIKNYNQFMGGVDLADRMLAVSPARARTRKWTIRFICHMVDLAVCNAWFEYRDRQKKNNVPSGKIPQMREFRLQLGETMLSEGVLSSDSDTCSDYEELQPKHKKRRSEIKAVPAEQFRHHKADHLIDYSEKQHRCRYLNCKQFSTAYCIKCEIYLCSTRRRNCFLKFHKK